MVVLLLLRQLTYFLPLLVLRQPGASFPNGFSSSVLRPGDVSQSLQPQRLLEPVQQQPVP